MQLPTMFGRRKRQVQGLPLVDIKLLTPSYINEGDMATFRITMFQPVAGMSFELYAANAGGNNADWDTPWHTLIRTQCDAHGLQYDEILGQRGKITVLPGYDGQPLTFSRRTVLDGTTESTEQCDIIFANPVACYTRNVVSMWIVDTSGTPPGAPTLRFVGTGGSNEGDVRTFTIVTENMIKGTKVRLYCVNVGADAGDWVENYQATMQAAAAAANCTWQFGAFPNDGYLTFTNNYSDANPFTFTRTIKPDLVTEIPIEQCDYIVGNVPAGIVVYNSAASIFIQDTSKTPTSLAWQVQMSNGQPAAGDTFSIRLFVEDGILAGGITLVEGGTATDADFVQTLDQDIAAVISLYPGLSYDPATNILTATTAWNGNFQINRTLKPTSGGKKYVLSLTDPTGLSKIKVKEDCCFVGGIAKVAYPAFLSGVNISGAEFGPSVMPGTVGTNYFYPTNAMLDYYKLKGFTWFRFPFQWGRLQRTLFGEFDAGEQGRLDAVVNYVTNTLGIHIILDPHNFAGYNNGTISGPIGILDGQIDPLAFYDLWERLAVRYGGNTKVHFNLMNEPTNAISGFEWRAYAQGALNAIRSRTTRTNLIIVPGTNYSSASAWLGSNAASFVNFKDPANNFIFEAHQYLDNDSSGTSGVCTVGAGARLNGFIGWCRENGYKAMMGEIGVSDPAVGGQGQCATEVPAFFNSILNNKDVFVGYTAWGAGAQWPTNYMFRLNPVNNVYTGGVDSGSLNTLKPFIVNTP